MINHVFANKIDDSKLIEIKIPVNFPTVTNVDDYEVVSGQIQLKEAYYNYVRLKVTRDTMYFICLPNTTKTRLVNANTITVKEISGIPVSKNGHGPLVKKGNTISEYNLQPFKYNYSAFGIFIKNNNVPVSLKINSPFINSPGKPPNFIG